MNLNIKYDLKSVKINYLNGSESYETNEVDSSQNEFKYRLLNIPEELLSDLQSQELTLKGDDKNLYFTTNSKVFVIKENFHSNSVFLMSSDRDSLPNLTYTAYNMQQSELELIPIHLKLTTDHIPLYTIEEYNGNLRNLDQEKPHSVIKKKDLIDSLPLSYKDFDEQWNGSLLVELPDGSVKKISPKVEAEILELMILSVIALKMDYNNIDLDAIIIKIKEIDENVNENIDLLVRSVSYKYSLNNTKELNMPEIAKFYGLMTLRKVCPSSKRKYIAVDDFYVYWKDSFPDYFNCEIDLEMLIGHFVKDVDSSKILEIDRDRLPKDIVKRVNYLMSIQSAWEQRYIQPFFDELNVKNIKRDNFIMKYARKKRERSGKIIITSR